MLSTTAKSTKNGRIFTKNYQDFIVTFYDLFTTLQKEVRGVSCRCHQKKKIEINTRMTEKTAEEENNKSY